MQIEKFKLNKKKVTICDQLRALKPGEQIRLTTAVDMRNSLGAISRLKRTLKKNFSTSVDGNDVLVFIRGNGV